MNVMNKANSLVAVGSLQNVKEMNDCLDDLFRQFTVSKENLEVFYAFYLKLLFRLFGENDTAKTTLSQSVTVGGWLNNLIQERKSSDQISSNGSPFMQTLPSTTGQFLLKFCPSSAAFDILRRIQGGYEFRTELLPAKMQLYLADHFIYPAIKSVNHTRIFQEILSTPVFMPIQRESIIQHGNLLLDPLEYFLISMIRYPTVFNDCFNKSPSTADWSKSFDHPKKSQSSPSTPIQALHKTGVKGWISGIPYLVLLEEYLSFFFAATSSPPLLLSEGTKTGSLPFVTQHREIFLRFAVEYWLDRQAILHDEPHKASQFRRALANNNLSFLDELLPGEESTQSQGLINPSEVIALDLAPAHFSGEITTASMQCTYLLVLKILNRPQLVSLFDNPTSSGQVLEDFLLVQRPLLSLLRCLFSSTGTTRRRQDEQVIAIALELWLLWMQPWTASEVANGKSVLKCNSDVPAEWKTYIAANLHFYTTLFVAYMKMIAKLNLSFRDSSGKNHIMMFDRVLKVYSNVNFVSNIERLQNIHTCSELERKLVKEQHENLVPHSYAVDFKEGSVDSALHIVSALSQLKKQFDKRKTMVDHLIAYLMEHLLRLLSRFNIVGTVTKKDANKEMVERCIENICTLIPSITSSMQFLENESNSPFPSTNVNTIHTTRYFQNGKLTSFGKEQILSGNYKCRKTEIPGGPVCSDPLDAPICSYEISFLAKFLITASKFLNEKYNLPMDRQWLFLEWHEVVRRSLVEGGLSQTLFTVQNCFRFNIRFLARLRVFLVFNWVIGTILSYLFGIHPMLWITYTAGIVAAFLYEYEIVSYI